MDIREIQKEKNEQYEERHVLAVGRLRGIVSEETVPERYLPYFQDVAIFLLELENVRRKVEWQQLCKSGLCSREVRAGNGTAAEYALCRNAFGNSLFI